MPHMNNWQFHDMNSGFFDFCPFPQTTRTYRHTHTSKNIATKGMLQELNRILLDNHRNSSHKYFM